MIVQPSSRIPGMSSWRRGRTATGGASSPYFCDGFDNADHVYSVWAAQLSSYSGSLIRVRRTSDSTEQDIGQDGNGLLDESALTSFTGSSDGYIVTLYDQVSTGAINLTQSTTSNQPKIVTTGTVLTDGTHPSASFTPTQYLDSASGWNPANEPYTIVAIVAGTTNAFGCIVFVGLSSSAIKYTRLLKTTSGFVDAEIRDSTSGKATSTTAITSGGGPRTVLVGLYSSSTSRSIYVNGTSEATNTTSVSISGFTPNIIGIGYNRDSTPDDAYTGYISDVFLVGDALSSGEISSITTS